MKVTLVKGCDPYVLGRLQANFILAYNYVIFLYKDHENYRKILFIWDVWGAGQVALPLISGQG